MTLERLDEILERFASCRIAVVGDFFLDKYLEFDPTLDETSLETGKHARQVVEIRHSPGACGTVVNNLVALGAGKVTPIGFTGNDGEGYDLRQDLQVLGCDLGYMSVRPDLLTPTYLKPRNIRVAGLEGETERYDTRNRLPLTGEIEDWVLRALIELLPALDAVIISDQVCEPNCGTVTERVRGELCRLASEFPEVVFWADSRERVGLFRDVIIKPNEFEAVKAAFPDGNPGMDDATVLEAGRTLAVHTGSSVFVTRGVRGVAVFDDKGCHEVRGVRADGPIDPTGAGDSATAGAILALCGGASNVEAALIANLTASVTVCELGVTGTASPEQLRRQLSVWQSQG